MKELSTTQARDLTDQIKVGVEAVWELVKQAYQSRAWAVLGYASWDDYCTREFGSSRIRLPREERQEVVASMREIGMSTRAIATATGTSQTQVRRELAGEPKGSPESVPAPVVGTDGKTYPSRPTPEPEPADDPLPEWEDVGTIPASQLKNLRPDPAPGLSHDDLDELNAPAPVEKPAPASESRDDTHYNHVDHLTQMLAHLRKASKEIKETIYLAQHLDGWDDGPITGDLRHLLDELDDTLSGGGFNAELVKLMEEGN